MGDTDTAMLWTIIGIFLLLGTILPYVHADFGQTETNLNSAGVEFAAGQSGETDVGILSVIVSILTMFFWTFGNIPAIMDLIIFVPMRIIFLVLLYRNLRGN